MPSDIAKVVQGRLMTNSAWPKSRFAGEDWLREFDRLFSHIESEVMEKVCDVLMKGDSGIPGWGHMATVLRDLRPPDRRIEDDPIPDPMEFVKARAGKFHQGFMKLCNLYFIDGKLGIGEFAKRVTGGCGRAGIDPKDCMSPEDWEWFTKIDFEDTRTALDIAAERHARNEAYRKAKRAGVAR